MLAHRRHDDNDLIAVQLGADASAGGAVEQFRVAQAGSAEFLDDKTQTLTLTLPKGDQFMVCAPLASTPYELPGAAADLAEAKDSFAAPRKECGSASGKGPTYN